MAQQKPKTPSAARTGGSGDATARRMRQLEEQIVDLQVVIGTLHFLVRGRGGVGERAVSAAPQRSDPSNLGRPQAVGGGAASDLAARVDVIETQISALTGQISQLTTQLADLQARLGATAPAVQPGSAPAGQLGQPSGTTPRPQAQPQGFGSLTVRPGQAQPAVVPRVQPKTPPLTQPGQVGREPPSQAGRRPAGQQVAASANSAANAAYLAAYGHLQRRDYRAAESSFRQFLTSFPEDANAASAQYWLGETYFIQGQYRKAATAFLKGYRKNRSGATAPDSLLKLGMALYQLGEKDASCATLSELTNKFPAAPPTIKQRAAAERRRAGC
ncbi:MAG: tol-pal system protein YbgF [Methyloligellaceae bacterium]